MLEQLLLRAGFCCCCWSDYTTPDSVSAKEAVATGSVIFGQIIPHQIGSVSKLLAARLLSDCAVSDWVCVKVAVATCNATFGQIILYQIVSASWLLFFF